MDSDLHDTRPKVRVLFLHVAALIYLIPLVALLVAIDGFDVWPGHDLPFSQNVSHLMSWSRRAIVYSFVGAMIFAPTLTMAACIGRYVPASVVLIAVFVCAPFITWYLRWYDALGMGV